VICVDSSVAVATVLSESRRPPDEFWATRIVASRLTDLETRVRAARHGKDSQQQAAIDFITSRVTFIEIDRRSVELLYRDIPPGLRTLDAIHLATLAYLNSGPRTVPLATYDRRLAAIAESFGFTVLAP
jgi:predicted nucleic acid-binding protein